MVTCSCGGNCSGRDVRPMTSKNRVPRSGWEPHCSKDVRKQCIIRNRTVWYHFRFSSTLSSEKSFKNIYQQTYIPTHIHTIIYDLSPFLIDRWTAAPIIRSNSPTIGRKRAQAIYVWHVCIYVCIHVCGYVCFSMISRDWKHLRRESRDWKHLEKRKWYHIA